MGNTQQATGEEVKKKSWFRRHKIITGIGIFFIISFLLPLMIASEQGDKPAPQKVNHEKDTESSSTTETLSEAAFMVGDTIKTEKLEITITNVKERKTVGGEYFNSTPAEGGVYVTVQWKYKNISDKPIGSWSTPRLKLVDFNGTEYSADIGASGNFATEIDPDRKIVSDLNPGISVNEVDVFEISKESYGDGTGWNLLVKADDDVVVGIK